MGRQDWSAPAPHATAVPVGLTAALTLLIQEIRDAIETEMIDGFADIVAAVTTSIPITAAATLSTRVALATTANPIAAGALTTGTWYLSSGKDSEYAQSLAVRALFDSNITSAQMGVFWYTDNGYGTSLGAECGALVSATTIVAHTLNASASRYYKVALTHASGANRNLTSSVLTVKG